MGRDRWEIERETEAEGWDVFRSGRVLAYGCASLADALRVIERRFGKGLRVRVVDAVEDSIFERTT